jgi:hypothetical protein
VIARRGRVAVRLIAAAGDINYAAACDPLYATRLALNPRDGSIGVGGKALAQLPSPRNDDCHNSIAPNEPSLGFSERRAALSAQQVAA